MPELPEVETTRRGIEPHVVGRQISNVIVRDSRLRWPVPEGLAEILKGQEVRSLHRRGKYLLVEFPLGHLLIHLGMSGSLRMVGPEDTLKVHDHVQFDFNSGLSLRLHDPRRFGAVLWTELPLEEHPLLSHLGPEPLEAGFTAEYLWSKARRRKQPIKTYIMDSRIVVGVGNIYANESLFRAGIRPTLAAGKVSLKRCERLVEEIKLTLSEAITQGGTTLRDFVGGDSKPGYFSQKLLVYGREGKACRVCKTRLKEIRLGQRSTVYCTKCQK